MKEVIANRGNTQWEFSSGLLSFTLGLKDFIKSCVLKSFLKWNFLGFRCLYNFVRGSHLSCFDENTSKSWILNQLCKIQPDFFFFFSFVNNLDNNMKTAGKYPSPWGGVKPFLSLSEKIVAEFSMIAIFILPLTVHLKSHLNFWNHHHLPGIVSPALFLQFNYCAPFRSLSNSSRELCFPGQWIPIAFLAASSWHWL